MDIDANGQIGGLPALAVRKLAKRMQFRGPDGMGVDEAADILGVPVHVAEKALTRLAEDGYVSPATHFTDQWMTTTQGNALAMASAAKRMKRPTAQKALAGILDRVEEINTSEDFLQNITEVRLFGSLLDPDRETIGDIDLAIAVEDKPVLSAARAGSQSEFQQLVAQHADRFAPPSTDWIARMFYYEIQVRQHLKGRTRARLHKIDELDQLATPSRRVWPKPKANG